MIVLTIPTHGRHLNFVHIQSQYDISLRRQEHLVRRIMDRANARQAQRYNKVNEFQMYPLLTFKRFAGMGSKENHPVTQSDDVY